MRLWRTLNSQWHDPQQIWCYPAMRHWRKNVASSYAKAYCYTKVLQKVPALSQWSFAVADNLLSNQIVRFGRNSLARLRYNFHSGLWQNFYFACNMCLDQTSDPLRPLLTGLYFLKIIQRKWKCQLESERRAWFENEVRGPRQDNNCLPSLIVN